VIKSSTCSFCITLIAGFVFTCFASTASGQWNQTTSHNPWSLEIGAKILDRPGNDLAIPLVTNSISLAPVFDSSQLAELSTAVAPELKFNFQTRNGRELELRSFIANWDETPGTLTGPNFTSPLFPAGITPDVLSFEHDSDMFNLEIMDRRAAVPGVVWMMGPRLLTTSDTIRSTRTVGAVVTEDTVRAKNVLMGFQGGLELNRPVFDGIYFSSFIKAGGYYNPTRGIFSTRVDNVAISQSELTESTASFLGEVGGRLTWDFIPNSLSGYAGYEATWIDGMALASTQILRSAGGQSAAIETDNTEFFQGLIFGLRMTY
jgi:hypothetical protein